MISLSTRRPGMRPLFVAHQRRRLQQPWLLLPGTLGAGVLLGWLLLTLIARVPHVRSYPVEVWSRAAHGMHAVEATAQLRYAYTKGQALIAIPEVGVGRYTISIQLASPNAEHPVSTLMAVDRLSYPPVEVAQLRVYHLLADADRWGNLRLTLASPTQVLAPDPRPLGLLVSRITVAAVTPALPPLGLVKGLFIVTGLLWVAVAAQEVRPGRLAPWMVLLTAIGLSASYLLTRGQLALAPIWLLLSLALAGALLLSRCEDLSPALTWRGVVVLVLAWRALLWLVACVGVRYAQEVYAYGAGNAYHPGLPSNSQAPWWWQAFLGSWLQWDSVHYLAIAEHGYTFAGVRWPTIAFFPLYPLLIRALMPLLGGSAGLAALVVSQVALLAAMLLLYDLVRRDFGPRVAARSLVFLLVFPTAFFFAAGYSESLALLLLVAILWLLQRQCWWPAAVVGAGLALTRLPGVLVSPVLMLAYLINQKRSWRALLQAGLLGLLPVLGLGAFLLYQWHSFGTPWAFLIAQRQWENGAGPPWTIPLELLVALRGSPAWELAAFQLLIWAGVLVLMVLACRRLPWIYSLSGGLMLLPPYVAQMSDSLPRHVLIAFPITVMLALATQPLWLRRLILAAMLFVLLGLTFLFVVGFFLG
ncbi:mannosyltransferase family protein [Kallotenue papyrolyticum]|uniref:mannosyltransferase family protein n=1 Tax=Kallotenue papyrolyticum TaxID=1325125 RepID=UPI000470EC34|nr:mannosyltransferase family protein [Kallotenue papyrolyticum]